MRISDWSSDVCSSDLGGEQTRVILMTPEGRFQPVAGQIGRSGGGTTEILSGLQGGERVVASGQFLIDSEASLSGALDRLNAGAPEEIGRASCRERVSTYV